MNKRPTVSILMALYNYEPFLEATLTSILNEVFTDFELLIWDDGSTDNSRKIAENFKQKDSRIQIFSSNKNCGRFSEVLMQLLPHARGEFINISDPDDLVHHNRLNCLTQAAKTNPDAIFYYGRVDAIRATDQTLVHSYASPFSFFEYFTRNYIPNGAMLVRTEDFKKIGGIDTSILWAEDYDFRLRLSLVGAFHFVETNFPMYMYIKHDTSYTTYRYDPTEEASFKTHLVNTYKHKAKTELSPPRTFTDFAKLYYLMAHDTKNSFERQPKRWTNGFQFLTYTSLKKKFHSLGICEGQTVFIELSMHQLGNVIGGIPTVIHALQSAVGDTGRLIVPLFGENGFSKTFAKQKNVTVLEHSHHPFAVWKASDATLDFNATDCWALLNSKNSKILMAGRDTISLFLDPFKIQSFSPFDMRIDSVPQLGHSHVYHYLNGLLPSDYILNTHSYIGSASCRLIDGAAFHEVVYTILKHDPFQFLCLNETCEFCPSKWKVKNEL